MKKGMERKILWDVLTIAFIMMLSLTIASSGQTPCREGDQTCDRGRDAPTEGASMLASSLSGDLAYDIDALNVVNLAFDFRDQSAQAPAVVQNIVIGNDTAAIIRLAPTDIDNRLLSYEILRPPEHGNVTGRAPDLIYMPEKGYTGNDSVIISVGDGLGGEETISIDIGIIGLYHPPSVRIRSPLNGEVFTIYPGETEALIPIHVTASGNMDGQEVELFDGPHEIDNLTCGASESDCRVTFNNKFAAGSHTLIAQATDDQGKTCRSSSAVIIVNPPEPKVEITSPSAGQIFTAPKSITIDADIIDSNPVVVAEFFANSEKIGQVLNGPPYSVAWRNASPGVHNLVVKARDSQTNEAISESVLIVVLPPNALATSDLAITKSSSSDPAPLNGLMNYMLTVINRGPDGATDVRVQDYLQPELAYISSTATQGEYSAGIWSVGDIAKYGSAKLVITVQTPAKMPPERKITNSAYVFGAEVDPNNYNNHVTIYTTLTESNKNASPKNKVHIHPG
jgi:uncharacterized repeat protein (TIGR01451 family)